MNLRFSKLRFNRFIGRDDLRVDRHQLIVEIKNNSQRFDLDEAELGQALIAIERRNYPIEQLCSGEDMIRILSLGFRRLLGNQKQADVQAEDLKRALRLAMPTASFCDSQIGRAVIDWQNKNPPFRIFD